MTIGELIEQYCRRTGTTNQRFAELCGVSKGYISQLINGRNPTTGRPITPTLETYIKIAEAMGISIDDLFRQIDDVPVALKKYPTTPQKPDISSIEFALIDAFHGLPETKQMDVLEFARFLQSQEDKKRGPHDD